jgi:hypothetical protein
MDPEESNKKPVEHVDKELESLLNEVKEPLPVGNISHPEVKDPLPVGNAPKPPVDQLPVVQGAAAIVQDKIENDTQVILEKFHDVTDRILRNFNDDRDEIEDTIDRLRDMLMSSAKPQSFVVEGLVSALKTKADTNSNIIKMLDAFAKIISSTKGTNIQQNTSIDLSALLANDQ